MKWFRHFNNANESTKLSTIIEKLGVEGYGKYWLFTELMARHWDGESEEIAMNVTTISRQLRHFKHRTTIQFLEMLSDIGMILFTFPNEKDKTIVTILFPILRELQDKDSKYNRKKVAKKSQSATLEEEKEKEKEKEEDKEKRGNSTLTIPEFSNLEISPALSRVPIEMQKEWLKTFGLVLVIDEISKLASEAKTNPAEANRILSIQRMSTWLSRGKEYQLRRVKTKTPTASTAAKKYFNKFEASA